MADEHRTFWLSFADADKPKGKQFLGVAIVEVDEQAAAEALIDIALRFPMAQDGAEWIAAASRKAWATGCNPGGQVASVEVAADLLENLAGTPRHVLLQKPDLRRLGHIR